MLQLIRRFIVSFALGNKPKGIEAMLKDDQPKTFTRLVQNTRTEKEPEIVAKALGELQSKFFPQSDKSVRKSDSLLLPRNQS